MEKTKSPRTSNWIYFILILSCMACSKEDASLYNSWQIESIEFENCQDTVNIGLLMFADAPCTDTSPDDCQYFVWELEENGDATQYQCFKTAKDTFDISFSELNSSSIVFYIGNDTVQMDYTINGDQLEFSGFDDSEDCDFILKGKKL